MTYTAAAVLGVAFAVLLDLALLRTKLLTRKVFWASYVIIVAFQLLVNGVLTGRRLVVYSSSAIIGSATPQFLGDWHVAYAPFEDLLFGFSLVLQTLSWWIWWGARIDARASLALSAGSPGAG
jgi:lycopene cyclase domain-containing protein